MCDDDSAQQQRNGVSFTERHDEAEEVLVLVLIFHFPPRSAKHTQSSFLARRRRARPPFENVLKCRRIRLLRPSRSFVALKGARPLFYTRAKFMTLKSRAQEKELWEARGETVSHPASERNNMLCTRQSTAKMEGEENRGLRARDYLKGALRRNSETFCTRFTIARGFGTFIRVSPATTERKKGRKDVPGLVWSGPLVPTTSLEYLLRREMHKVEGREKQKNKVSLRLR